MKDILQQLSATDLSALATALRSGRLRSPYSAMGVQRFAGSAQAESLAANLQALASDGFTEQQIATVCEMLVRHTPPESFLERHVELVTTGPDTDLVTNRDTSVVVRDIFANAKESVLLAGYAVFRGERVFQALAKRMEEIPALRVQCLLDIQRPYGDQTLADVLVKRFVATFKTRNWPEGARLPELYYDPRSLETDTTRRASLHAKCVVVDRAQAFISSANFTEAAQQKNIEVGVLVKAASMAQKLNAHFQALIENGALRRAQST